MNIKERAYQIASVDMKNKCSPAELEDFAEALVAELAKENEPVGWSKFDKVSKCWHPQYEQYAETHAKSENWKQLYTLPPTAEQIEQETAEACAKLVSNMSEIGEYSPYIKAIRSGAWKEYK